MLDTTAATDILSVFTQYGFKKTSMEDIAQAAGLSRQSIYNRFGSKEAALIWAVGAFFSGTLDDAVDALTGSDAPPEIALADAFKKRVGNHVQIWAGTPHGVEILEFAMASSSCTAQDLEEEFAARITSFLVETGLVKTGAEAVEKFYVLYLASKGLMVQVENPSQYADGIERTIRVLVRRESN